MKEPFALIHSRSRARYFNNILRGIIPACTYSPPRYWMNWQMRLREEL